MEKSSTVQPVGTLVLKGTTTSSSTEDNSTEKGKARHGIIASIFTSSIFGYSFAISTFSIGMVGITSMVPLTKWPKNQLPRVNMAWYYGYVMGMMAVNVVLYITAAVAMYDSKIWPHFGPKPAWRVNFVLGIIVLEFFWVALPLMFGDVVGWKFNLLDLFFNTFSLTLYHVLAIYIRKLWFRRKRDENRRPTLRNSFKEAVLKIDHGIETKRSAGNHAILAAIDTLIQLTTIVLYPILIIRKLKLFVSIAIMKLPCAFLTLKILCFKKNSTLSVDYR